jgi:hypothetical protein
MKRKTAFAGLLLLLTAALLLPSCGKAEFGLTENTGTQMTITAKNAQEDSFFMAGALEVAEAEQIVISSGIEKGVVRVEIVAEPEEQGELPSIDDEAILTANVSEGTDFAGTVPAGRYLLRAICTEKATGTVQIEVTAAG